MEKFKILFFATVTFAVAACSPVNFQTVKTDPVTTTAVTPGQTCNIENIYRKTKIMFLVDTSGSNASATYNQLPNGQIVQSPATDPSKSFRGGAIDTFFSTYRHKTNFAWGFATFSADTARALVNNGSVNSPLISTDSTKMDSAISTFRSSSADNGNTPYASAISMAANAIANDADLNASDKPTYFVILLSDGVPTDYTDANGNFRTSQMQTDVANLLARAPGRVTLSTIFYSALDNDASAAQAKSIMQQIASSGSGMYASVNSSNSAFKIDDVVSSTSTTCQ